MYYIYIEDRRRRGSRNNTNNTYILFVQTIHVNSFREGMEICPFYPIYRRYGKMSFLSNGGRIFKKEKK